MTRSALRPGYPPTPNAATAKATRPLFAVVGAMLITLLVTACGNSAATDAANAYIAGLNTIGAQMQTLSSVGDPNSAAFKAALASAVPQMQSGLTAMKSAQPNLTGEAANIANTATPEVETLVNASVAMNTAVQAGDMAAAQVQLNIYNETLPKIQASIEQWNSKVANQK